MSGLARQLAGQYFGFQGGGQMQLGSMSAVGAAHAQAQNSLAQATGEWSPSEEGIMQLSQQAGALETQAVVVQRYAKVLSERNRALGGLVRATGGAVQNAARQSLENARMQNQFMKGIIPLSLDMGSTVANHQGRVNGLQGSRIRSFG
jgi:hypothetical protein